MMSGEVLISAMKQQRKLLILIAVLFFIYILVGYMSMMQQRELTNAKQRMLDAKYEYMTRSAQLVDLTRQSTVANELRARGSRLQENKKPPIKIQP